jgi:cytochrome c oxidase subunit 3
VTPPSVTLAEPALDRGALTPVPPLFDGALPAGRLLAADPPPVSNARIAMLAFIAFETMLFMGLLSGYTVLRWGSAAWPPVGQPYLPIAVTWLNTFVLLGSCAPLILGARAHRRGEAAPAVRGLGLAAAMGALFLGIQGYEWVRLLSHGLRIAGGTYGATFMILIGSHGLHVVGAVVWLGIVAIAAATGRLGPERGSVLDICAMYWYFVCLLWIAIFAMVYLA